MLEDFCVWDFISCVDKVSKSCFKHHVAKNTCSNTNNHIDNQEKEDENDESTLDSHTYHAMHSPKTLIPLQEEHFESESHCLTVCSIDKKFLPVPIGSSIPRHDQKEVYARYCRLMLIFFKPWRHASDLRLVDQTWEDSFTQFCETCPQNVKKFMNNMQLLHECRDSSQDHFGSQHNQTQTNHTNSNYRQHETDDDFGPVDSEIILEHLQSISNCSTQSYARSQENVNDCILSAEASGMFDINNQAIFSQESHKLIPQDGLQLVSNHDLILEEQWKADYEIRRDSWKRKTTETTLFQQTQNASNTFDLSPNNLNSGSLLCEALQNFNPTNATISQQIPATITECHIDLDAIIQEFTLNTEQARAFRIIYEHSLTRQDEALRMYIGGAGGTGKSRIINALKEYFIQR